MRSERIVNVVDSETRAGAQTECLDPIDSVNVRGLLEELVKKMIAQNTQSVTMTNEEAAAIRGVEPAHMRNIVSLQLRSTGKDYPWVMRAGSRYGYMIHSAKFMEWMEQDPPRRRKRRG